MQPSLPIGKRFACVTAIGVLLPCLALGCQPAKRVIPSAKLSGQVTVDGQPVIKGGVTFAPTAVGQGPSGYAEIIEGRYSAPSVPLGKVNVQFQASKTTGRMVEMDGAKVAEQVSLIPAKFRAGIPLEVKGDKADQNFDLRTR